MVVLGGFLGWLGFLDRFDHLVGEVFEPQNLAIPPFQAVVLLG